MPPRRSRDTSVPVFRSRVPVLTSSFRYADCGPFLGKARLYSDRVELTGWGLRGRHRRRIELATIAYMDYGPSGTTSVEAANLALHLSNDEVVRLRVDDAHRWRERYEDWYRYAVLPSAKLLADVEAVAALAG